MAVCRAALRNCISICHNVGLRESSNAYVEVFEDVKPAGNDYEHFICKKPFFGKGHLYLWADRFRQVKRFPDYNRNYSIKLLNEGNFDVFHPTYFSDYFLPYLNGKPFVLTIHDMIPELYPQYFKRDDFQIRMKKELAPLASAIVAVSETTKRDVIRILGIPEEKVHVVYHGCSFPTVENIKPLYSFPYILYVGARYAYKNFIPFINNIEPVLNKYKNLKVVCTGSPFNDKELKLFEELNIQNRMMHRWVKDDTELYALYRHAVCFVYPSEYEGFGIPILEAYQTGCPVMLNDASCFPEIAGDAAVYFEMKSNHSDLAEKLENVLTMSTIERENLLAKQCKRLARFSWEKSAEKLSHIYRSLG